MAPRIQGKGIVLMGVSGAGKSTIGAMLAESFNCRFVDADDYHPQANKEKMKNGIPLSEEDRIPWLETLQEILKEGIIANQILVLGCSALQSRYREILRCADPDYKQGSNDCSVKFILLDAGVEVLAARLEKRAAEGKHFMPAKLLQSQIDLLQIDEAEDILTVDATLDPQAIVDLIQASSIVS